MPKKQSDDLSRKDEPSQTTEEGLVIPVPKRDEFFGNLEKVAPKAERPERSGSKQPRKRRGE
jgi:hypothetical protein